ncbi:Zinc/iron permease [Melanogaster broomeanus]|nr:Zinc/iron permease [Melanogaster broomeanus]
MFSSGFQNVAVMSLVMGTSSYGVGLVPLSMSPSRKHLSVLSNLGTGLLIGTALGVIIPEGIEEAVVNDEERDSYAFNIALYILLGFAFMFFVEEYVSPHARPLTSHPSTAQPEEATFDLHLEELERQEGVLPNSPESTGSSRRRPHDSTIQRAYPLSLGLMIHALVDGYVLGVSASNTGSSNLSLIVFLAIIIHKTPTALALTTSLLANSLPVGECKRHLLLFSLATPVSSVLSYAFYAFSSENRNDGYGGPLLFSGGTFLYVATVLQSVSDHAPESSPTEIHKSARTVLLMVGMFLPLLVSRLVGHGH